jgi:hypothetical protein
MPSVALTKIHHQNELLKQRIYKDNKIYTPLNALKAAWYTAWDVLSLHKVYENEGRNNFHE